MPQKNDHDKIKIKGQQPRKGWLYAMWVNVGLEIRWENVNHPMDKTINLCVHGCWFTLVIKFCPNLRQISILTTPQGGMWISTTLVPTCLFPFE
jgi:hypothetical protein